MTLRNFHTLNNIVRGMAATLLVAGLMVQAGAQDNQRQAKGLPNDWTHQHVIFSNPGTMQDAIQNGTYEHWLRVQTDPRFKMQQLRRQTVQLPESEQAQQRVEQGARGKLGRGKLKKDWNVSLGVGGVAATMYPAKYSFDINNASCTDFVVFPANSAGVAAVAAHQTGTFTNTNTPAGTATITNGSDSLVLTATAGSSSASCTISGNMSSGSFHVVAANGTTDATSLAALINASNCGSFVGVSANSAGAVVTVTATTPGGDGDNIGLTETLTHFGWGGTTLANGAGQGNLVGITNLYSGSGGLCGANPTVRFSYEVGTGTVQTSPSLSYDGTKVAYVESVAAAPSFMC